MAGTTLRKVIKIDEERCDGCGLCAKACHEGAIQIVDGKARLVRDDYCDGLGDCVGECPQGAISFETRQALPYDEAAAAASKGAQGAGRACPACGPAMEPAQAAEPCGCPSAKARVVAHSAAHGRPQAATASALTNWPTQLALIPVNAPYLQGADLLITADCVPLAFGGFHSELLPGKVAIQACPKLDDIQAHTAKLAAIVAANDVRSITVARMEVPCCGGLVQAVRAAVAACGKTTPVSVAVVGIDGSISWME